GGQLRPARPVRPGRERLLERLRARLLLRRRPRAPLPRRLRAPANLRAQRPAPASRARLRRRRTREGRLADELLLQVGLDRCTAEVRVDVRIAFVPKGSADVLEV